MTRQELAAELGVEPSHLDSIVKDMRDKEIPTDIAMKRLLFQMSEGSVAEIKAAIELMHDALIYLSDDIAADEENAQ